MNKILFHVGMPKCASTLLQKEIFPNIIDAEFLAQRELHDAVGRKSLDGGEAARQLILKNYAEKIAASDYPAVFSSEHLSMPGGWLETRKNTRYPMLSRNEITEHLKRLGGESRVLLILRKQEDWLNSWYQERIKRYECRNPKDFVDSDTFAEISPYLLYSDTLKHYQDVFGKENVIALPYELLRSNRENFLAKVFDAIGVENRDMETPRVKGRQNGWILRMRRHSNKFLNAIASVSGGYSPADRGLFSLFKWIYSHDWVINKLTGSGNSPKLALPADLRVAIRKDNKQLSELLNIDLSEFGYDF